MTTPDVFERVAELLSGPRAREVGQLERIRAALTFLGESRSLTNTGDFAMNLPEAIEAAQTYVSKQYVAGQITLREQQALEHVIEAAGMYRDLCK